jgi:uncharacterized RDD family membrane protein YckC
MICSRCAHWNNEDEHRCTKCAARLNDRQVESAFYSYGALALQPEMAVVGVPVGVPVGMLDEPEGLGLEIRNEFEDLQSRLPRYVSSLQQSLFPLRESSKVVSIDGQEPERRPAKKAATASKRRTVTASYLPEQGVLEFVPMALPQPRKLATSVDAKIYCSHPVASVTHRLLATVYDLGFISMLLLAFLGILCWGCDDLSWALGDPLTATVLAAGAVLIGLIYNSVFLAVRGETPGMRFAGLQLVDFDGRATTEEQLHMRILGAFFSVLPAGVGLLWALVDEESLTWQDHISHTFPTPIAAE